MRSRGTVILFLIAAVLAAWYFFFQKPRGEESRRAAHDQHNLINFEVADVTRLMVARAPDTLLLEIRGTHWHLLEPVDDIAEQASVGRLLNAIASATIERNLGSHEDLDRFGLRSPACVITLADADGVRLRLDVGDYTLDRASVYALRGGEVLLVPTGVRRYALVPAEDFRNRRVVNFDLSMVTSYLLESGDGAMRWDRSGSDWITVSGGDTIPGDTEEVEGVLRRLRGLRAYGFPTPDHAVGFFPGPHWRITVFKANDAPPVTLRAAPGDSGWTYTRVDDETRYVMVDSTIHRVFASDLNSLRDRRLLHFDPQRCARLSISTPDTSVTLTRSGTSWAYPNPAFPPPDAERVATLVAGLIRLRFESVIASPWTGGVWPPGSARFEVVVEDSRGNILDEIRCRPAASGHYEVMGKSLGLLARIDPEELDRLVQLLSRLRTY